MAKKKSRVMKDGMHLVVEPSTLAIAAVCFLLFNVIVFSAGYVAGVEDRRSDRITTSHLAAEVPSLQPTATASDEAPDEEPPPQEEPALESSYEIAPIEIGDVSLSELYRSMVRDGGSAMDALAAADMRTAHLRSAESDSAAARRGPQYAVQLGAFSSRAGAEAAQAEAAGFETEIVPSRLPGGDRVHLVILSKHRSLSDAHFAATSYRDETGRDAAAVVLRAPDRSATYMDAHR